MLSRVGEFRSEELLERITINPQVMAGKPAIRGTRITVDLILELLVAGMEPEKIVEDYKISVEDVSLVYGEYPEEDLDYSLALSLSARR